MEICDLLLFRTFLKEWLIEGLLNTKKTAHVTKKKVKTYAKNNMDFWFLNVGVLIVGDCNEGENRLLLNSDIRGLLSLICNGGDGNEPCFLVVGNDGGESAIVFIHKIRIQMTRVCKI